MTRNAQLRQAGRLFHAQIRDTANARHDGAHAVGQFGQLVQVRAEHLEGNVRRRAAQSFIDPHPERRRKEHAHARQLHDPRPHVVFDRPRRSIAGRLQDDQHVRHGVRHRIFGALRSSGPADDVLHLRHLSQHIFHAMVQPIDFIERRLRRQHGLQEIRAFVELRHEVGADARGQGEHGDRDDDGDRHHQPAAPQAGVEQGRVGAFERPQQRHIVRPARRRGLQQRTGDEGNGRQRQDQRRADRGNDGRRQRPVHPSFDPRHAEERHEDRDDDQRGEGDRPADLNRRPLHGRASVLVADAASADARCSR